MNSVLEPLEMPPKSFYVLGTNWFCYVEPSENDLAFLKGEELLVELGSKAIEAFFGLRDNNSLDIIDKEKEPTIGVLLGIADKGSEEDEDKFGYIPSYLPLANIGKYQSSVIAQKAFNEFAASLKKSAKPSKKISKNKSNKLPEFPEPPSEPSNS